MAIVSGILRQTGDDTLDMETDEVIDDAHFSFALLVGIGTDDGVTALGRLILNAVEHRGIIVANEVRYDDANHPRRLLAQTLCKGVRAVVQFLGQCLHPLLHLLPNLGRTAQGSAHSGNTHAQLQGEILQ